MSKAFKFDWVVVEKPAPKVANQAMPTGPGIRATRSAHTFAGAGLVAAPRIIQMKTMTAAEADEEFRSKSVCATLVNMPICLIEPASRASGGEVPQDFSWGIQDLRADQSSCDGKDVVVAVLDTGIDPDHPAFVGVDLKQQDFTGEGLKDEDGHGTHCAGTIFGRDVGGIRIGVARGVKKALIGKVLGQKEGGSTKALIQALQWAQFNGADVISMSLGMDFPGFLEGLISDHGMAPRRAASIALEAYRLNLEMFNKFSSSVIGVPGIVDGSIVVGAAGNESEIPDYTIAASLPANALEFVSVAALSRPAGAAYSLARFSNVGAKIGAPGTDIWSARAGGGLAPMNGTSMAAPHVAGAACLWIEKMKSGGKTVNAPDVINMIRSSASPLEPSIAADMIKWGRATAPV